MRGADCGMTGGATVCTDGQLEGMWKESAVASIPNLRDCSVGHFYLPFTAQR